MGDNHLYRSIADAIRKDIILGKYKPGDKLPTIRKLCEDWKCTPGTIQRAYAELIREGLLVSRPGDGTRIAGMVSPVRVQVEETLRRAGLVNKAEAFLLEMLTSGYVLSEIQESIDLAMDRWRTLNLLVQNRSDHNLQFTGSNDLVISEIARSYFGHHIKDVILNLTYAGSLGGLIALSEEKTDIAGCHLWDAETGTYNIPFVKRLLPGKKITVVVLAHRRQGFIIAPGNPKNISSFSDLLRSDVVFVNRQSGSGTRVWFDAMLEKQHIDSAMIDGYTQECLTHSDVAKSIALGSADVGLGLELAGYAYGLDFIFLNKERYDLVLRTEVAEQPVWQSFIQWLGSPEAKTLVSQHVGYDSNETGAVYYL